MGWWYTNVKGHLWVCFSLHSSPHASLHCRSFGPQSEKIKKAFQKAFKKFSFGNCHTMQYENCWLPWCYLWSEHWHLQTIPQTGRWDKLRTREVKPSTEYHQTDVRCHQTNIHPKPPSNFSANEEIFQQAIPHYIAALERGFNPPFNNNTFTKSFAEPCQEALSATTQILQDLQQEQG